MGLSGPPTWKMKKFTAAEFQDIIGDIEAHARYVPIVFLSSSIFFDGFLLDTPTFASMAT